MKSTDPETPPAGRMAAAASGRPVRAVAWRAAVVSVLPVLALLPALSAAAEPSADACTAARDRDLQALAAAAIAVANVLDTDAAVDGAPEYELQQARDGQMAEIERARRDVEERFRRCAAGDAISR